LDTANYFYYIIKGLVVDQKTVNALFKRRLEVDDPQVKIKALSVGKI